MALDLNQQQPQEEPVVENDTAIADEEYMFEDDGTDMGGIFDDAYGQQPEHDSYDIFGGDDADALVGGNITPNQNRVSGLQQVQEDLHEQGTGMNPTLSFQNGVTQDVDATKDRRIQKAMKDGKLSMATTIEAMAGDPESNELLMAAAPHITKLVLEQQEEYMNPETGSDYAHVDNSNLVQIEDVDLKAYQAAYERSTGKPFYIPKDLEARSVMATQLTFMRKISEIADNRTTAGKITDLGVELAESTVLPIDSMSTISFVEKLKGDEGSFIGSFFTAGNDLESFSKVFWKLPRKDQEAMYQNIVRTAKEVSDNPDVQKQLVTSLVFSGGKEATQLQAMTDFIPFIGAGVKAATKVSSRVLKLAEKRIAKLGGKEAAMARVQDLAERLHPSKAIVEAKAMTAERVAEGATEATATAKEVEGTVTQLAKLDAKEAATLEKEISGIMSDLAAAGELSKAEVTVAQLQHYGTKFMRRSMSGVRASRGNPDTASAMVHASLSHPELAKVVGTSQLDAAMTAIPMSKLAHILDGAAPEIAARVHKNLERANELMKEGINSVEASSTISIGEKQAFIQDKIKHISREPDVVDMTADSVTEIGNHNFSVEVLKTDGTTEIRTLPYERSAITGGFINGGRTTGEDVKHLLKFFTSARIKLGEKASKDYVDAVGQVNIKEAKLKGMIGTEAREVYKGLNKASRVRVDAAVHKGTLENTEFSYNDLVRGGRPDLIQLNDTEFEAYTKFRVLAEHVWQTNNAAARKTMQDMGTKHVKMGSDEFFGEAVDMDTARAMIRTDTALHGAERSRIYVPDENTVLHLSSHNSTGPMGQANLVTRLQSGELELRKVVGDPIKDPESNTFYKYALVRKEFVQDLPVQVIKYRSGWSPLVYKDANFFVKAEDKFATIDGRTQSSFTTYRAFSNIADAEKYSKELNESGKFVEGVEAKVFRDREMSPTDMEEQRINMLGGYSKAVRKQERLKMGLEGEEANFMTPSEAIGKYIGTAARDYAASQNKTALIQRWMNEANLHVSTKADIPTFYGMRGVVEQEVKDVILRDKLLEAHDQITTMVGFYGNQENTISRAYTSLIEGTLMRSNSDLVKKIGSTLYRFDGTSVPNLMRSTATHALLGCYNPAQLLVQGSAFTTALSISPRHAPKALGWALKATSTDMAFDTEEAVLKAGKFSKDELEFIQAWKRSGLRDASLSHNDDFHAIRNGVPMDRSMIQRIKGNSMVFFEQGELFNTRFSFGTAFSEWKAANKGKEFDDAALRNVIARTDVLKMRMMDNNRAGFQRNSLAAIPTQFWQVTTKTLESMIGHDLTGAEKVRLLGGQIAFWGASGTGIDWVINQAMDSMGVAPEDVPAGVELFRKGMVNAMLQASGMNVEVGTRLNPFTAPMDLVAKFADPTVPFWEIIMGPTGSVAGRASKGIDYLVYAANGVLHSDSVDSTTYLNAMQLVGEAFAEIPSTSRNILKATMMYNSQSMVNSKGQSIWETDINLATATAKAFGLSTRDELNYYKLGSKMTIEKSDEAKLVDALVTIYAKPAALLGEDDLARGRDTKRFAIDAVLSGIKDPRVKRSVITKFENRITKGTGTKEEYIRKMLTSYLVNGSELTATGEMYNPMVIEEAKKMYNK